MTRFSIRTRCARPLPQHPVEDLLDVLAFRHRQHVAAGPVHPPHVVLADRVLGELHPVPLEAAHHVVAAAGGLVDRALVDDAVVGPGDLGDVVLGRALARDDGVVHPVHAHGEGAGVATCAFSMSSTSAALGGVIAAMVPAVPPPTTRRRRSDAAGR